MPQERPSDVLPPNREPAHFVRGEAELDRLAGSAVETAWRVGSPGLLYKRDKESPRGDVSGGGEFSLSVHIFRVGFSKQEYMELYR